MESPISMSLLGQDFCTSPFLNFLFQHVCDFLHVHSKTVAKQHCYKSRDMKGMKTHSMKWPLDEEDSLYSLETSSLLEHEADSTSDYFCDSISISQTSQ